MEFRTIIICCIKVDIEVVVGFKYNITIINQFSSEGGTTARAQLNGT